MPRGPKISKNIERLILHVHEENPDLTAKEVHSELWKTKEWKMIPERNVPKNWPGVDAIQKLIKNARERKIRFGPELADRPWSHISLAKYPIPPEALPFILRVWARSMEKNDPLTINQALWISRIFTLYNVKSSGNISESSILGKTAPSMSMPTSLRDLDELWAIAKTLALNEKVFRNEYPPDEYPSGKDDILYYWMCDAELYGILPEGEPSARGLILRLHEEISSKFAPEYKTKSERESTLKELRKKMNQEESRERVDN